MARLRLRQLAKNNHHPIVPTQERSSLCISMWGHPKLVIPAGIGNAPTMEVRLCLTVRQSLTSTSCTGSQTPAGTCV